MSTNNPGNVVQIHEHAAFTRRFSRTSATRLLHDCRDRALQRLASTVARAMDNVDDALFALADKASTNARQGHYFDAMREIRINRQDIETSFKQTFGEAADRLIADTDTESSRPSLPGIADAGLSLVEHDDLEESLAINTLIDKLEALCHGELFALDERVGFLLGGDKLAAGANPIGPRTVCAAFKTACGNIASGVDIKLIVFKLFDKYVCENIQELYHDINDYLASNGVLPKIAVQIKNGQQPQAGNGLSRDKNTMSNPGGAEPDFLTAFAQLLSAGSQTGAGVCIAPFAESAPNLMRELTLLQQGRWESLGTQAAAIDPSVLASGTTNVVRIIKDHSPGNGAGNGDDMVIEVVALLFDYIFDNENIPDKAKALIGRLQIPTLKVAILDKSFFSKRYHPARRLLNSLAHATVGLGAEHAEESALYQALEACVLKVQVEFETDIAVFEAALSELEAYLDQHQSHLDENIEEAKKVVQGRERLKIAESLAEDAIAGKLEGKPFPEFIKTFALDKWKNLLVVAYLKGGAESDAWKNRLAMLDLLIWSTLPKTTLKDKKKLVDMLPTLISGIETGMKLLAIDDGEKGEFLEKLASCHARAVNAETYTDVKPAAFNPLGLEVSYLPTENEPTVAPAIPTVSGAAPAARKVGSMLVEDLPLLGRGDGLNQGHPREQPPQGLLIRIDPFGEAAPSAPPVAADRREEIVAADEYTELMENLIPGIWFEFRDGDVQTMERLSWISSLLGSYLFTDHDGLKTRELSAQDLEERLRSGRAAVADDLSFLVDRSLSGVLDDLQKKIAG